MSPSGWIEFDEEEAQPLEGFTTCDNQFAINWDKIKSIQKETVVPFKIMSFDIEASSSHGDFPVPVKSYKKLAGNIMEFYDKSEKIQLRISGNIKINYQKSYLTALLTRLKIVFHLTKGMQVITLGKLRVNLILT